MEKVIISGFGGQGVLFTGKLLAFTGMVTGKHVSWIPSYGPEMRGGTANCSVIISEKEITSPIVNQCTTLLALNSPSLEKFQDSVETNGKILFDGSMIQQMKPEGLPVEWLAINTKPLADELGTNSLLNMILLGAFIKETTILSIDDLYKGMEEMIGNKKPERLKLNKKALEIGFQWKERTNAYV
ncbi:2-oxoacid:acceptor oxidoreductase family protein [Neobacillus sp.]|uniref:2-oxoacid:acceptor oxidoreductase family protein n=1 Tax=Neobacillus sp. TaxID=2675273 RepID=UPI00289710D5|nr:2-oxoacid:acceptor oxidoreductase family protein [Neobacillus sp.]